MGASDSLFAVFGEGKENFEALAAVVADKVIGGHILILLESGSEWECSRKAFYHHKYR